MAKMKVPAKMPKGMSKMPKGPHMMNGKMMGKKRVKK